MTSAALVIALAAAALYLPSRIDMALRNHRTRQARAQARAECHASYWLESSEPCEAWAEEETPVYDDLCWRLWEQQMEGSA